MLVGIAFPSEKEKAFYSFFFSEMNSDREGNRKGSLNDVNDVALICFSFNDVD